MIIINMDHLRRVLKAYTRYYNESRTHLSLEKNAPAPRAIKWSGRIAATPHLGGLRHEYTRI